jgi:hypothetical protein
MQAMGAGESEKWLPAASVAGEEILKKYTHPTACLTIF